MALTVRAKESIKTALAMVKVSQLYLPTLYGLIVSGIAYMFVMPRLEGFLELGTMIFVITLGLCYVFYSPVQMLGRAMGLALSDFSDSTNGIAWSARGEQRFA